MGDLGSDTDAAISIILEEHPKLKRHDPQHALLRFICDITNDGFKLTKEPESRNAFCTTYGYPDMRAPLGIMLSRYAADLIGAVDGYEGTSRLAKPKQSESNWQSMRHEPDPFKYDPDSFGW